ncbi:MAG TPA: fibronectin type III domain-containing protein [Bacteroidia bacterium]|nr:fibronectin type III domain-containing protein [Bacteroidia bacterium]
MATTALNLSGKPVSYIIEKARFILAKMTGNVTFPTPIPTLIVLVALIDALSLAYENALGGGKVQKALMRLALKDLLDALKTMSGYVQSVSAGDETKILSSGFDVRRPRTPAGILPPPVNLRSVFGFLPGEIIVRWGGVKKKLIYKMQINDTPGDETKWKDHTYTGRNRLVVTGLVSDKMYEFRIASISAEGLGSYSDPSAHKAL